MERPLFEPQDLSRVSLILAVLVLSQLALRFLVVVVIAKKFGTSELADVIFIAQFIPINLFLQNRKALMLSFVPVYTEYIVQADEEEVWQFTSQFTNLVVIAGLAVTAAYVLAAPLLMGLMTVGFPPEQRELTTRFTQLLAPAMFLFIVFSLEESLLYSFRHYTTTSWTILFGGLGGLLGVLLLTDRLGVFGYGYGSLAGYLLQVALPLTLFWKYRQRFSFSLNLRDPGLRKIYKLLTPVYLFSVLMALIHLASRTLATTLGPGRVSAFQYCVTLAGIVPLILTGSVLAPLFPIIAEKVVRKEMEDLKDLLRRGTQVLFFAVAPIIAVLVVLRVPVIRFFFERGEFTPEDTRLTADTFVFLAPFMLAMTLSQFYSQIVVTLGLINSVVKSAVVLVVANVLLCLLTMPFLDVGGIALSMTLVLFIQALIFLWLIRQRAGPMGFRRLVRPTLKVLAACLVCSAPTFYFCRQLEVAMDVSRLSFRVLALALEGGLFFLLFAGCVRVFRMQEAGMFLELLKTRKKGKGPGEALPAMGA